MAFDTTAANTGHLTAACISIQIALERPLLWSGCRHHIGVVLLTHVFNTLHVENSRLPEVDLFVRLRNNWTLMSTDESGPLSFYTPDDAEPQCLLGMRAELEKCVTGMVNHKRGDYREFVQLLLLYLGNTLGGTSSAARLQRPGALHKARWMAKLLSTLKLAMLEKRIAALPQGTITTRQQQPRVRSFANFIVHVYAIWWMTCNKAVDAAWNDLTLYHNLCSYRAINAVVSAAATKALERHLWYLMAEMLPLSLLSAKVPDGERRALADAILDCKPDDVPVSAPQQRFGTGFGKPKFPALSPTTRLAELANSDCWFGMHQLHIDAAFLPLAVEDWDSSASYQASSANVRAINVVNDCAERGLKLTSDFVAVARSEPHLQNVLQTVEHDRSKRPNLRSGKRKLTAA